MLLGELCAVLFGFRRLSDVSRVVEQRDDHAKDCPIEAELPIGRRSPLMTDGEPSHGKHGIQSVLAIVVDRVDALVPMNASAEQQCEDIEGAMDRFERAPRPCGYKQCADRVSDGAGATDLHTTGHIVIVAPMPGRRVSERWLHERTMRCTLSHS